ncbi:MAG: 1,4-alpha-glucan branching protein domain-containing protein [Solirubrobacterales bacterium]
MSEPAGDAVGDLAIVLHSHMPYVEGFGTYPFGEEWLFDAAIHSHLPILDFAHDLTMTVTPVLADQLEAPGVAERLREFLVDHRIGAAQKDVESADPEYRAAAEAELARYEKALAVLDAHEDGVLGAFAGAQSSGRVSLAASSATHAVLPLLASRRGIDLQVETGLRSHRRRFGWQGGFWLPECAYVPDLEWDLARNGVQWFCTDQSRHEGDGDALLPVATEAGPVAFTIDWPAISWLWDMSGYPSWPGYLDFHRLSMNGIHIFRIDGDPYDAEAAAARASEQADQFIDAALERLGGFRERTGERGLMVYAVDTELLGHWWSEGPIWLEHVLARAEQRGLGLVTLDQAAAEHRTRDADLKPSTWGENKDFSTWDEPVVSDLTWGARKLELEVSRAVASGLDRGNAERAARELLAVQSSDWAFLDNRKQAGDYPYLRATRHAESAFEALQSAPHVQLDTRVRSLAPDLSLTPLLTP